MNETEHKVHIADSRDLRMLGDGSVDLVVTSPPYPMIQMWDSLFSRLSPAAADALERENGDSAFDLMHAELDRCWAELFRVLKDGAFACINIGDATRTVGGKFRLYSNHSRVTTAMSALGFSCLPVILWRKKTNLPNKFMGSGMLPPGAYVTLEHEYILIFRKGGKRTFPDDAAAAGRRCSAYFWEERNRWFSDFWEFKGASQKLRKSDLRERSAAYPFELAYRLINMYSVRGDAVLDPFIGTGTTAFAAIASGRNSIGLEIDESFSGHIFKEPGDIQDQANQRIEKRLLDHNEFIESYIEKKGGTKYVNAPHGVPVVTRQEKELELYRVADITSPEHLCVRAEYGRF